MPLTILSCCKIGEYKLPACYIIVTKMLHFAEDKILQTGIGSRQKATDACH